MNDKRKRTTIGLKIETMQRLDGLGFDKHIPYDRVINRLIDEYNLVKRKSIDGFILAQIKRYNNLLSEDFHNAVKEIMSKRLDEVQLYFTTKGARK